MEIAGTLELADIRHAYRWTWDLQEQEIREASPTGLDRRLFGAFFLAVALILIFANQPFVALASTLIGMLLLFPSLAHQPRHLYWQYVLLPAQYREQTNLFQIRWVIDDLGIDLHDARPSERRYNWTDYGAYAADEEGFLLYWWPQPGEDVTQLGEREQIVHYLPRRFFTPEQASEFSAFLKEKFPG
jgi:hypothetical protein